MNETNTVMPKSPLEQYEQTIAKVFTYENLTAILAVVHSFKPSYDEARIKETEFETIKHNAMIDGMNMITKRIIEFVESRGVLPVSLPKN